MKSAYTLLFFILFSTLVNAQNVDATKWDYRSFPDIPFDLKHLNLHLTVEPTSGQINGVAEYEISSRRDHLTQIVFNTADLEIQSITKDEDALEFHVSNDSLYIQLGDSLSIDQPYSFRITWQSASIYGIHTDASGNMWTSLNPHSLHHWLPILDHPQIRSTIDADITVPTGLTAVFNGQLLNEEILSDNEVKTFWSSKEEIPVTQLSLAVGKLDKSEAISGIHKIGLFADEMILSQNKRAQLLETAVQSLKKSEQNLVFEYPYVSLNIVILPDHYWNEIQYGAGIIFLYKNLGSLSAQLSRGIAAQWFGSYHNYVNEISDAGKYEFLKALMLQSQQVNLLENKDSMKTIAAWNVQVKALENAETSFFKTLVKNNLSELIRRVKGVSGWNDYAEYLYEKTGYYWDSLPANNSNSTPEDSVIRYHVRYELDEESNQLRLHFNALDGKGVSSLADVVAMQHSFGDTISTSFSFTGLQDIVDLELSGAVDYVTLQPLAETDLLFFEQKPFLYLISQLRSSKPEERLAAAKGLIAHKNHPDLQLAISDAYSREKSAVVKAALLNTLGVVLNGASGTEQTFLDQLNSDNPGIREAAVKSLAHYPENEQVENALRNVLLKVTSDSLFEIALQSYSAVIGTSALLQLADRLLIADSTGQRSLKIISVAMKSDSTGQSYNFADQVTKSTYPYNIRKQALQLLQTYQHETTYWENRLPELLTDDDPRIRTSALESLQFLHEEDRSAWLKMRRDEEYDIRVLAKVKSLMN